MADRIHCPNCQYEIEVSAVLAAQLREQVRKEHEAEARRWQRELAEQEETLRDREEALEESRRTLEKEVAKRVEQEHVRLAEEALVTARAGVALEVQDLQEQLAESTTKLDQARQAELQLRKARRELEEQKRELELTVSRTLDEEREKIRDNAKQAADEEHRLKEADKDKLIGDLRNQIHDLKRKSEQGSQQAQGEVMELELEELLANTFPYDELEPVAKGVHGGDVKQHVRDANGQDCGIILWETKRTKSWNDGWLAKLREDQRAARAHVAVLMSAELPKGVTTFTCVDGVWVTNRQCALGLALALRVSMIEAARTRRTLDGRHTKAELLYGYLSGSEFRQRVEGIVEAFISMKHDLESEKRSLQRLWNKREKQIELAVINTASLYGDLGGIMGASLPQVACLDLAAVAASPALEMIDEEANSA